MKNFYDWLTEQINPLVLGSERVEDKISPFFNKSKLSIDLVRQYDALLPQGEKLLWDISVVAPLTKGVFGMFTSGENINILGPDVDRKLQLKFGKNTYKKYKTQLERLPYYLLNKQIKNFPEIRIDEIKPSSVIHVNVGKNIAQHAGKPGSEALTVLEIASTIVHEATHAKDVKMGREPTESNALTAEANFRAWFMKNSKRLAANPMFRGLGLEKIIFS
jgi:hypothetical protein